MFESAVSYVLNRFLGKYIQNLDSSNLNVSIFKGDVELTDLQLRPEALVELKLPIEVKAGYVGYIKVDIQWTSLFSSSVVVRVEDVYMLAGPVTDRMYDPERERALQNAIKREVLESLGTTTLNQVASSSEEDPGFFEKLYTYVVNNLQVSIGRVHLRYEDTVTNPDHPFACGIMLKHISAYTTDSKWQPDQMENAATVIHKLLEMRELSVYWNPYIPEQHLIRSRINTDGWRNLLKQSILKHSIFEEDFDFIIEPVSAETRLIISKDNNSSMPKVFADISLAEIDVLLSRQQFLNILNLKDSFQLMSVNQKYRKYHPNVPLKISPRSWWMYAYTAVVEERIRPYSWERIKEHRTKYRKYKELYKKSLESPNHESTKAKLWELEETLDVYNIIMAREQAKTEYAPEKIVKKEKKEKGWWSSWFGGSGSEDEEVDIDFGEESTGTDWLSKLTPEEKEKLYQGIGYDENENVAMLPREYVEYKVQINLKSCCLSLVNYSKKILQVSVTQMLGSWETRPAGDAYRISCHTESFTVEGASIEHELVPIVTSDVNVYAPSVNQVFTLDFESNPLYVDADFSLKTNIQPVEVVYDEHSICEVRAFFQLPTGTIDVRTAAMETMQEVVRISQAGLIYAIEKHKTVHLAVNMKSPYIVIPEFGTLHRGGNVLIADLGMLQIKSELQPKDSSLEHGNLSDSEIAARLYDQFNITITDVKVLLADSGDDWHTAQVQPTSEYHILPSMKLMFDFYNTVKPDYKQLPQQKIITTLPSFEINISDKKLLLLWKFLRNFPLPSSTSISMLGEDMIDACMSASYTIEERLKHHIALDPNEIQAEPDIKELRVMKQRVLGRRVIIKSKKQPKSPPQFLSDEADNPFVDEGDTEDWVKYEDIKAVDDISSTHNTTDIVLRVVIREVVIQLSKSMDRVESPYLMFRAERLRLDAAITEHGVASHASLGAIQLVDKIHVGTSGEYLELLSTKPGTDLVSVLYRKVENDCPDFDTVYHSVEQGLKCQFETLNILADQGAIMYLKAYIEGIQTSIHSTEMVTSVSTVLSSLVTDPSKVTTRQKSQPEDDTGTKPETNNSVVQWNIIFELHDLSLVMADNNSKIAEIHIRDLKGHMLQRQDKLTLVGSLRDIDVKDCTHGALYPNILMLEDKEDSLFRFSFTKFSRRQNPVPDNRQMEQPFDYIINIRVGHLQLVALGKFYWEIMKFAEPLLSAEVLDTASVSMKAVTKQMDSFKQDNRRFGITVDMLTPTILIPVKSDSVDLLLLKSGDLHVNNVFDITDIGHGVKQEWNHIYVSLTYVQLSRAKLSQEDDAFLVASSLLEPMTFQTDIRLALEPEMSDVQTDIACKLEKINCYMSQKDCQVLFGVLRANWTEGAPLSEPEPVRRAPITTQTSEESGTVVMDTDMTSSTSAKKTSTVVLFTLEGMELVLTQDTKEEGAVDFAKLMMGKISGTVNARGDGETKVTVALETLYVLNIKPDSRHVVKKILYYDKESIEKETDSRRPLVSVIYKISGDGNQKADIMMEKVTINVQIPYMLEMSNFFTEALTPPVTMETPDGGGHTPAPAPPESGSEEGPGMTVYLSISQPEIVLLAHPESHNSRIIVVNVSHYDKFSDKFNCYHGNLFKARQADIAFEYVANPTQQRMWSKIAGLKMFSSIYRAPTDYQSKMITPCDLEFNRCYDIVKNELQMSIKLVKLLIHLTPPNMRLLMDVVDILKQPADQSTDVKQDDTLVSKPEEMWKIKTVSPGRWIDKWNEEPATGPVFGPLDPPIETLTVDIQEVCAFFEVENLDQTVPLLCIRTSVDGKVSNWTKQMRLTADLELDVCYYNEKLSVWEPLVEPNLVQEGLYEPWALKIQIFQAQSFPIVCSYDDNGLDVPDGLQSDVEQMINRNHFRSSSSENEADEELDSPSEMTILRPKNTRRKIRIASDKSYESLSRHSSVQGESDSESESLIHTITNKLGSIFTTDSSEDADISETDDNDEGLDWTLDKPIFLTPQGPVKFRTGPERYDEIDGLPSVDIGEPEISTEDEGQCMYMIFSSPHKLMVNITLPAINIIRDVLQSLDKANPDDLMDTKKLPALAVNNKLGVDTDVILHKSVKIHDDYVHGCRICNPGDMRHMATPSHDDINVITEEEEEEDSASLSSQRRPLTFVNQTLADAGHTLVSAGAFVFDDDVMSGAQLDRDGVQIQVAGFDTSSVQMMNRACRKLIHLTPKQSDELENEHGTKYYMVYDVDMNHSHKTVTLQSPLQTNVDAETFANIKGDFSSNIMDKAYPSDGYDSLRPTADSSAVMNVTLDWNLVSLNDFDETNGYLDVSGFVTIQWVSDSYTTTLDAVELIRPNLVWKPPVVLLNSVETYEIIGHDTSVKVRYNFTTKECQWKPWVVARAACSPDVKYYPFDKQSCAFRLSVWGYKSDEINLTSRTNTWGFLYFEENGEWEINKTSVSLQSPLQLKNNLTMSVDVFVLKDELQTYRRNSKLVPVKEDFMKLTTLAPQELFAIPLFAAYHCALYICPTDLLYEKTSSAIWWPDLVHTKDRQKYFSCKSQSDEKLFNIKVVCQEGEALRPPQMLTRTIPYFTITLHPPVVLHNYLPYDLQFSLQGSESTSSLTHGDSTPLYTVNMSQAYKLNLFVADYLTCDWKGTLDITQEMEEFKAISMDTDLDPDNNNKHLSLSVHCNHDKTWNFYIYSPYWIVNKTDLTFQIRGSMSDVALECLPASYPQLFRYKKNKRKKAKLKVYESHWSHAFSMDTVGNCGVVECHDNQRRRKYTFMVQCQLSKLKLTKIITVLPFFLLVNSSSKPLRYMEENKATDLWFDLAVGQCSPFWPVTESYSMFVKYERSNVVSQHFPFKSFNNTVLRMENGTALCVGVSGGTQNPITVQFTDYDVGDAPVRVDNFCDDVFIKIHQKNQSQTTILSSNQSVLYTWDDPTAERTLMWNIYGRNKPNFPAALLKDGYDQVNLKLKSLKSSGTVDYVDAPDQSDSSPEDDTDEADGLVGKINESLIGKTRSDKLVIFWVSYLDHQQRVLLFTQDERVAKGARKAHVQGIDIPHERGVIKMNEAEQASSVLFVSLDGICVSMINKAYEEVALLTLSSIPATWEVEVNNRWKMLNVELQTWLEDQWKNKQAHASLQEQFEADLGKMQMLKPYMGALRRSYSPGLWFNYRASQHHMSLHAKIQKVQLDNQLPDAYFPTVLHPCPTPVYVVRKKGHKPFIEVGMMRRTVPENNVDTFRYMKVLMQEFNIKIDKGFMMSLYDVFANLLAEEESESSKVQSDLILTQRSLMDVAAVMIHDRPNRIFFEYLRLSPLKMHISFSLNGTPHLSQENKPSLVSDIVDFFLSSVGATFTEMKDVELRMAYYEVKGRSLSWKQLSEQIQSHYTHQAIQQAYVLILGLDVLGNPYGLVKDFTQGFGDLFYEPFLDSVQGSDEFADSLVRGVHSMLGNTVGGAAGSVARITGSLGSALAAMSLDKNYKMKRRATMQQRPANLPLSLALAGRGFVMGVCLGLSGVVLDPIRGAQEEGVEGFFKGVGKGIMGLLTKPTGGVFDMVSMAFDGLQRASDLESGLVHRMRKPRFINPYLGLRPYSVLQAVGANLLLNVNKGQYAKSDMYWAHAPLSPADRADVLLITTRNILLLQKHRCWGGWDIEWEVKVENILGFPAIVNNKLVFKVKPDETSVNIFTGEEQEICCDDKEMLRWIQQRIENLMKYKQR